MDNITCPVSMLLDYILSNWQYYMSSFYVIRLY